MKLFTALSALAAIMPAAMAADAYIPYARFSKQGELFPINAVNGSFYIGKDPTIIPPAWGNPDDYNQTIITGPTGNRMWMGVLAAGGQAVYVQYDGLHYNPVSPNGTAGGIYPYFNNYELYFSIGKTDDGELKLLNAIGRNYYPPGEKSYDFSAGYEYAGASVASVNAGIPDPHVTPFEMILKRTDAPAPQRYQHYQDQVNNL